MTQEGFDLFLSFESVFVILHSRLFCPWQWYVVGIGHSWVVDIKAKMTFILAPLVALTNHGPNHSPNGELSANDEGSGLSRKLVELHFKLNNIVTKYGIGH